MQSQHQKALEVLKYDKGYLSPRQIINMGHLRMTDGTLSRRLREDRAVGILKSRKFETMDNRLYTAYAWKKSQKAGK
jgi:hypothetical protein